MSTDVAGNVRAVVARRMVGQQALAAELGLTQRAVSRRLRGEVDWSGPEIAALARILDVSTDLLLQPASEISA